MRHQLIKESSEAFPRPRGLVQTEGLKMLREENHNRLQRNKEGKLVNAEIVKLKQIFENRRLVMQKKLQETSDKAEAFPNRSKPIKLHSKLSKKLEHCDAPGKMSAWLTCSFQTSFETRVGQQEILARDLQKQTKKCCSEETPEFVSFRKTNSIEGEDECKNQFWGENKGKQEIINGFFENDEVLLEQEFPNLVKEEVNIESFPVMHNMLNQKNVRRILGNWKKNTQCKNQTEKKTSRHKIEQFLSKLKEIKMKSEKNKTLIVNSRSKIKRWKIEKNNETDEKLKKLMEEVKLSQKEVLQKFQKEKTTFEVDTKFLVRMEERRKERTKRRKEFEEKKLKLEEQKENIQRQKEEEQKRKYEQERRKKLEDIKKKQREEKQKREEQKREKEKLKVRIGLAVAYYRVYLLRGYGLRPWLRLMKAREAQHQQADSFFERKLKQEMLNGWIASVREESDLKVKCAVAFYERVLKKNCLIIWMERRMESIRQNQVAEDWCDFKITEKALKKWLLFAKSEQLEYKIKESIAALNYQRKLQMVYIQKLRNYPVLKRLEQEKEYRKRKWRQKVKEILPDYEPVSTFEDV